MATRKSSSRQTRQSKTIDLTANKSSEPDGDVTVGNSDDGGSSGYDILKAAPKAEQDYLAKETEADKSDLSEDQPYSDFASGREEIPYSAEETARASGADAGAGDEVPRREIAGPVVAGRSGSSFGAMLLSAILGGGVALGGATLIGNPFSGASPEAANSTVADLAARIETLSGQVDALRTVDAGAVQEALTLARTAVDTTGKTAAELQALNRQVMESGSGNPVDMDALKAAIAGDTALLSERIAALEAMDSGATMPDMQSEIAGIRQQLAQLDELQRSGEQIRTAVDGMDDRLKLLETTIKQDVLPSMESVQEAAGAAVESQKIARSVSARALGSVLENGGSFAGELASVEALVGQSENITALRDLSAKGVLSKEALAKEFAGVSDAVLAVEEPDNTNLGVVDKLFASARSLVKVRPAGPVDGNAVSAIVSRIEAALEAGDIAGAINEWNTLPETAKSASANWHGLAQERLEVQSRLNNLIGELGLSSPNKG